MTKEQKLMELIYDRLVEGDLEFCNHNGINNIKIINSYPLIINYQPQIAFTKDDIDYILTLQSIN